MSAPAGWFHDPEGQDRLRYWDGSVWTEHYAPLPDGGGAEAAGGGAAPGTSGSGSAAGGYGGTPGGYGGASAPGGYGSGSAPGGYGGAPAQGGYGGASAPGGYGAAPGGYGSGSSPEGYGGASAPGGYGAPQGGYAAAPTGYGAPQGGYAATPPPGGKSNKVVIAVVAALVGVLVIVGAIFGVRAIIGNDDEEPTADPTTQQPTDDPTTDEPTDEPTTGEPTEAGALVPGTPLQAQIPAGGPLLVPFTVDAGGMYVLYTASGEGIDPALQLRSVDGALSIGNDDRPGVTRSVVEDGLQALVAAYLVPGEYEVEVTEWDGLEGDVVLNAQHVADAEEIPRDTTSPFEIPASSVWTSWVTLDEAGTLTVDVRADAEGADLNMTVVAPDGETHGGDDRGDEVAGSTGGTALDPYVTASLEPGVYVVLVASWGGDAETATINVTVG